MSDDEVDGKPSYEGPGGNVLYFMAERGWMVGPESGSGKGFLFNEGGVMFGDDGDEECPSTLKHGWRYANGGMWYEDFSLVARCAEDESGIVERIRGP